MSRGGGADTKVSGIFYNAVAQSLFLFGVETWVLTPRMEQDLDSFQNNHQEAAVVPTYGWDLGIPASDGGTEGSGVRGDNEVGHKDTEHGRVIY